MIGLMFLLYPIFEIYACYIVIQNQGFMNFFMWSVLSFFLGVFIIANQSRRAPTMNQLQNPEAMVHHFLIILGGLMILLPGVISDACGFLLVLPGVRHILLLMFKKSLVGKMSNGSFRVFTNVGSFGSAGPSGFGQQGPFGFSAGHSEREVSGEVLDVQPSKIENRVISQENKQK